MIEPLPQPYTAILFPYTKASHKAKRYSNQTDERRWYGKRAGRRLGVLPQERRHPAQQIGEPAIGFVAPPRPVCAGGCHFLPICFENIKAICFLNSW